jgi:archaellum component FlaC
MYRKSGVTAATHGRIIEDLNRESEELTKRAEELRVKGMTALTRDKAMLYSENSKALTREVSKIAKQIVHLQKEFEQDAVAENRSGWLSLFFKKLFAL